MRNSVIIAAAADFDVHRRKTTVVGEEREKEEDEFRSTILQKVFTFTWKRDVRDSNFASSSLPNSEVTMRELFRSEEKKKLIFFSLEDMLCFPKQDERKK